MCGIDGGNDMTRFPFTAYIFSRRFHGCGFCPVLRIMGRAPMLCMARGVCLRGNVEFDALISFFLQQLREHLHDFAIDDLVLEVV